MGSFGIFDPGNHTRGFAPAMAPACLVHSGIRDSANSWFNLWVGRITYFMLPLHRLLPTAPASH